MFRLPLRTAALCLGITLAGLTTAGCYGEAHPAFAQLSPATPIVQNETPEKFLQTIFANYKKNGAGASLQLPANIRLADPAFYDLIRRDLEASKGEIPILEIDPICDCQDYDISNLRITTKPGKDSTLAVATFDNSGDKNTTVGFDLIRSGGVWRIADISTQATPSTKRFLSEQLAKSAAPR